MMKKRYYYYVFVIVLCVFLCHPVFAAKCVRPNGNGGCFDNIQDAIDAVNPGGTVQVYPGIYYELFDANKPGITIEGMGNKRTDVRVDLLSLGSDYNEISAANVTIKNLTIQNSYHGIIIFGTSNSKFLNVNIFNSTNLGIYINNAHDILIKNCKILKSGASGVYNISGEQLAVQNTTIYDCEYGVFCSGDYLMVDGCTIKNSVLDLIHVEASNATIRDNQLFQADRHGIYAISDFVKVTGNLVRGTGDYGIDIAGEAPVIKKNKVMHAQGSGFSITCSGGDSKVVNNQSSYNGGYGFYINSSSFLLFKKNKAFYNDWTGFFLEGNGVKMIIENQSKNNGQDGFICWDNATLENNISSENGSTGYSLTWSNTAIKNKALNNMTTGFVLVGDNLLRNNKAIGNLEYGINVIGDSNNIINNTMLDSLHDKCDEGNNNDWTGNTYDTECP